jgi:hypothetical protein
MGTCLLVGWFTKVHVWTLWDQDATVLFHGVHGVPVLQTDTLDSISGVRSWR